MAEGETNQQPNYDDLYRSMHGYKIESIKTWVQHPPAGVFNHLDLKWEVAERYVSKRGRIQLDTAHIPWSRVDDFIIGEETHSRCDFVRKDHREHKEGTLASPTWVSFSDSSRYHCHHGPQDFSGRRQEIIPEGPRRKWDKKGKYIPNGKGHKGPRNTPAKNGGSVKRGCRCSFTVKRYYYSPEVAEIVYVEKKHVNDKGLPAHGSVQVSEDSALGAEKNVAVVNTEVGDPCAQKVEKDVAVVNTKVGDCSALGNKKDAADLSMKVSDHCALRALGAVVDPFQLQPEPETIIQKVVRITTENNGISLKRIRDFVSSDKSDWRVVRRKIDMTMPKGEPVT